MYNSSMGSMVMFIDIVFCMIIDKVDKEKQ